MNGQYFVTAEGMVNEMPDPPGPNAFRVRVLARGRIVERSDPFLSPCNPVIEDLQNLKVEGLALAARLIPPQGIARGLRVKGGAMRRF